MASRYLESTCWLGARRFSYTADFSAGRCSCRLKPQHFPLAPGNPFISRKPACTGSLGPLGLGVLGLHGLHPGHQAVGYPAADPTRVWLSELAASQVPLQSPAFRGLGCGQDSTALTGAMAHDSDSLPMTTAAPSTLAGCVHCHLLGGAGFWV